MNGVSGKPNNSLTKVFQCIPMALLLVFVVCSTSWAAEYYIDKNNGSDENSGALSDPWKTIGKANATLKAGDTVYIKGGVFNNTVIRPGNSGTASDPITYARYESEKVVLSFVSGLRTTAINLSNRDHIVIDGIDVDGNAIGDDSHVREWVNMDSGSYNVVKNCNFKRCYGWSGVKIGHGAHHNKILDNTMKNCGGKARNNGDMITIGVETGTPHHNLVEGNTLSHAGHNIVNVEGYQNIIRNNDLSNPNGRILTLRKLNAYGERNLFENNRVHDNGVPKNNSRPPSMKLLGEYQIVRNNMLYNNVAHAMQIPVGASNVGTKANHLRVYNNVFYNNGAEAIKLFTYNARGLDTSANSYVNNIIFGNGQVGISLEPETGGFNGNRIINNNMLQKPGAKGYIRTESFGTNTVPWYENRHPDYVYQNKASAPEFVDAASGDFRLEAQSPMIDAGAWLTTTKDAGSGTKIPVNDASFFMDGWGVIKGDVIQLENQSKTARITDIDYDNNIVTVDKSLSWKESQGVSLQYNGSAIDIGAFESQGGNNTASILPPANLRVIN